MSDVLYKVNCGRLNNIQVIHCNCMRKCKKQTLLGEQPPEDKKAPEVIPEIPEPDFEVSFHKAKRERRKPTWLSDYVLSLSRNSLMPNTKMTTKGQANMPDLQGSQVAGRIPVSPRVLRYEAGWL